MAAHPGQLLWQALEAVPGLCCTDGEWRQLLGAEYVGASQYLRADGRLAMSYPCPAKPECGCIHRVVRHGTDRFVGVCACEPPRCSRQTLSRGDLELIRVDPNMLGSEVATCLGIDPHHEVVPGLVSMWGIGTYRPRLGVGVPAYLTIQRDADSLEHAVLGLSAHAGGAFGLVLPTRRFLRATIAALLNRAGGHVVVLSEDMLLGDDGAVTARRSAESIWEPCLTRASQALPRFSPTEVADSVTESLSENAGRVLDALLPFRGESWPGGDALRRDPRPAVKGKQRPAMHKAAFTAAVQELVRAGAIDLKGRSRPHKGCAWAFVRDPRTKVEPKSNQR